MGQRGAVIAVGLLLAVAACTSEPAPKPEPSASSAPSSEMICTDPVGQVTELPGGYRLVAGVVAVPSDRVLQMSASGERDPAAQFFAKWGLLVRTGETVGVAVAPGWEDKARVGWGKPGPQAVRVSVTACPVGSATAGWTAFAGGSWVAAPACVPLVIQAGSRTERIRLPIGVPCT
jgi:hypothetical protein